MIDSICFCVKQATRGLANMDKAWSTHDVPVPVYDDYDTLFSQPNGLLIKYSQRPVLGNVNEDVRRCNEDINKIK